MRGFLVALLAACSLPAHADSCVWYADFDSIRQVQTSSSQVTRVVPLLDPHRLVMDARDCGVWTLDRLDRRILRFDAEGRLERVIAVRDLGAGVEQVEKLHVDPYDGSLWLTDDQQIAHVSAQGQLLGSFRAPGAVRRMEVALDQTLWVLGTRDLWHFDASGTLLATYALGAHLSADARYFAIDATGGVIWLVDENDLARLELAAPTAEPPLRIRLDHRITGFALDPHSGNVWVAQHDALIAFSRSGALGHRVELEALNIRMPEKLGFDPVSRSLWAGAERSVSRFTDTGQFVIRFPARDGDEALGMPAFKVEPTLTLIRPPQDALANNPRPEFRLGYGAECNGVTCGFPGSYFSGYQLSAILNGQPIGSAFQFDPLAVESFFVPPTPLADGLHTFSAQVKDGFGHSSSSVSSTLTIDTIAPQFLALGPADGAVLQAPFATVQGSVDDPLATVVLETSGLTQTGGTFSFPVTLLPGANIIRISAIDRAGNSVTAQRTLNFIPLSISITSPASGATVSGSSVQVSGTILGPPNTGVTVNGVVAALAGDRFYANVPLQAGANALTVVAKTQDGFIAQQSVSVTSSGPAPIEVTATSLAGLAPLQVEFTVAAASVTIQRIDVDFDGNGTLDFTTANRSAAIGFTYAQPGTYAARVVVTDGAGNATTHTLQIVVQDAALLDLQLKAAWSGFLGKLIARDKAAALTYLSGSAATRYGRVFDSLQGSLPAIATGLSAIEPAALSASVSEYVVTRARADGTLRLFLIYFLLDQDGVWRIDSM